MPGVLTHLSVAFVGFLIVYFISKNWIYGFSFAFGHLIPDVIKFGIPGVELETTSFNRIVASPLFWTLNSYTHSFFYWGILIFFVLFFLYLLRKFDKIKYEKFRWIVILILMIYLGAIVHLVLDIFIIEKSYWI